MVKVSLHFTSMLLLFILEHFCSFGVFSLSASKSVSKFRSFANVKSSSIHWSSTSQTIFKLLTQCLQQWCTTFFGHGPQIDLSNASGAKQVSRPKLHVGLGECVSTFTKMMCTVKHTA